MKCNQLGWCVAIWTIAIFMAVPCLGGELFRPPLPIWGDRQIEWATGKVVDESGNPVAGAQVWHLMDIWQGECITDADGRFRLQVSVAQWRNHEPTIYHGKILARTSDGHCGIVKLPEKLTDFTQLKDLRLELNEGRRFDLHVIDHAGNAVPQATAMLCAEAFAIEVTQTDSQGNATLIAPQGLEIESLLVDAKERGINYIRFDEKTGKPTVPIEKDEAGRSVVSLAKVRPLILRAVDEEGEPIAGVSVKFCPGIPDRGRYCHVQYYGVIETDEQGEATIYVPEGSNEKSFLLTSKRGYFRRRYIDTDLGLATRTEAIVDVFEKMVLLSGRVVLEDGTPVEEAILSLYGQGYVAPEQKNKTAWSDKEGRFEAWVRPECLYTISVRKLPQYAVQLEQIVRKAPVEELKIVLHPQAQIRGKIIPVLARDANNLKYSTVYISPENEAASREVPVAEILEPPLTEEEKALPPLTFPKPPMNAPVGDGRYEAADPPGRYRLTWSWGISEGGHVEATLDAPTVADLRVKRGEGTTLSGRIVPPNLGRGISGVTVTLVCDDASDPPTSTVSDDRGIYRLPLRLVPRWAGAFDRKEQIGNVGRLPAGTDRAIIEVGKLGRLNGKLIDADSGQPLANRSICLRVELYREDGSTFHDFPLWGKTDDEGRYELAGLVEAYRHQLSVLPPDAKPQDPSALLPIKTLEKHPGGNTNVGAISVSRSP